MNKFDAELDLLFKEVLNEIEKRVLEYKEVIKQQVYAKAVEFFGPDKTNLVDQDEKTFLINIYGTPEEKKRELGADNQPPANKHLAFMDNLIKEIQ